MIGRSLSIAAAFILASMVACGGGSNDPAPAPAAADGGTATQAFSQVLTIDQIAVYQGAKVSLVSEEEAVAPKAPVIPNRPALVRVHANIPPRTKVPKLSAELRVSAPGQPDLVLTNESRTIKAFDEGDLSSSFYWELSPEQVVTGAQLSVEIRDPSGADPTVVRYPAEGELAMNVGDFQPTLKVKFVPIRYEADGSNRLPTLDNTTLDDFRDALYKLYPVTKIEFSVRDALPWPLEVRGDGQGWGQLLDAVMETRQDDKVPDDVYYVGVFTPAATQREYCQESCVLGIAPASGPSSDDVALRTAMIVGYKSERSHGTLAQELAHAMGRLHAPCGNPTAIDKKYPYSDASIGTWGWDVITKELVDPARYVDFMSYCDPVWVSDYTYAGIYDRMLEVEHENKAAKGTASQQQQAMKTYHVEKDGSFRAGPTIRVSRASSTSSAADEVVLEDASHQKIGSIRGSFRPISNIGGGILVTPTELPASMLKRTRFARPIAAR